ncbi:nucleotide exchange factor GrpE [Corynebacterium mendelii]|uniref:Protein GrpE n=1 Tax=Corynebacterium mendelii TaxID=2765362 RepID=A0A939E3V9_9CORY|nr:nucleotide exchange factor GrpE [Corynebacterium mendelii]MBN9645196.1 nucleotide exchange factor GrpE [Corynebacterium mendelii]
MSNPESKPETPGAGTDQPVNPEQEQPDTADLDAGNDTPDAAEADASAAGDNGDSAGEEESSNPTVEDQLAERTEDLQRVTAEYANFRRRTARERDALVAHAKSSVVTEFLPVMDDLDLVDQHGDLTGPLKAVHDKITGTFGKLGVTRFGDPGDGFDPEIHEAVQDISSGDDKVIGTVLRPGYMFGDRLVRTAMVIIADADSPAE